MSALGAFSQFLALLTALLLAPLLTGWVNQWRARLQNKSAPALFQPYKMLHKLFNKESLMAEHASPLFRMAPYLVFSCMLLACAITVSYTHLDVYKRQLFVRASGLFD